MKHGDLILKCVDILDSVYVDAKTGRVAQHFDDKAKSFHSSIMKYSGSWATYKFPHSVGDIVLTNYYVFNALRLVKKWSKCALRSAKHPCKVIQAAMETTNARLSEFISRHANDILFDPILKSEQVSFLMENTLNTLEGVHPMFKDQLINNFTSMRNKHGVSGVPMGNVAFDIIDFQKQLSGFDPITVMGDPMYYQSFVTGNRFVGARFKGRIQMLSIMPQDSRNLWGEYTQIWNRIHDTTNNISSLGLNEVDWMRDVHAYEHRFTQLIDAIPDNTKISPEFAVFIAHDVIGATMYGSKSQVSPYFIQRTYKYDALIKERIIEHYKKDAFKIGPGFKDIMEAGEPDSYFMELILCVLIIQNYVGSVARMRYALTEFRKFVEDRRIKNVLNTLHTRALKKPKSSSDRNMIHHVAISYLLTATYISTLTL